jgi:hypothetical protein
MTLRCYVGAQVFLKLCKLRNHLQFGGSPYLPASHRTKAVKPIIDNCAKVRSRRTINLVLFTNRPRCCAREISKRKLVLKCDREFKKVQRCKNYTLLLSGGYCLPRSVEGYGANVSNDTQLKARSSQIAPSGNKKYGPGDGVPGPVKRQARLGWACRKRIGEITNQKSF